MHLADNTLQALIDGELGAAEQTAARAHLGACPDCQRQWTALQARSERVQASLARLAPGRGPTPERAYAQFAAYRTAAEKEKVPMLKSIFAPRLRPVWTGVSLAAALAIAFSFAPVRAWAGEFLGLFRVQQVTVLEIDPSRFTELTGNEPLAQQIGQLISDSLTVLKEPGPDRAAASALEASQLAGFSVRLPLSRTDAPQLTVEDSAAFQFTIDRERAQALLDTTGRTDLQLPALLAGAVIKVEIPASVTAGYGTCPTPRDAEADPDQAGSMARRFGSCVMLAQLPSPSVTTPPDLDVAQLAELGLQFTGMSAVEARAFAQTVDWTSTLVIPIPRNAASYEQVPVDGVIGTLIKRPADDAPEYALIWVKNGIVYAIGGLGSDASQALAMADSLR